MATIFTLYGLKMAFYVAVLVTLALYANRQAREKDAVLADYADVCRRLQVSENTRLTLVAVVNDLKRSSEDAKQRILEAQSAALAIRAGYEQQALDAALKPIGNPFDYLISEATK